MRPPVSELQRLCRFPGPWQYAELRSGAAATREAPSIRSPNLLHWNVFFSSCFKDTGDEYLAIRERVRSAFNLAGSKPVWMGEDFPAIAPVSPLPPIDKALFCVKGVRHCDAYVAVVIDKHGSGVEVAPGLTTQASFLELELFEAAVSSKPAFVFILEGHEPRGRMAALLKLLAPALPGLCWQPLSEDEILKRLERIVHGTHRSWLGRLRRFTASSRVAHDRLGGSRHRPYQPAAELPALQFLNGPYDPSLDPPSLETAEHLLSAVNGYADYQSRLAIIWMALRELMGERPSRASGDRLLHCWDLALAKWTSSGAWYGLHGYCLMGCLGAISSRSRILREYSRPPATPHGAFASEYYSIAKKVGDDRLRSALFALALDHIDLALNMEESPGALAVRGSIYQQIGRAAEAVADYRRVIELQKGSGAPDLALGASKAELGFALLRDRSRRKQGLQLLEEGVELASRGAPDGFLIRAKRKLGLGYFRTGAFRQALGQLVEAHDLAQQNSLFDQIGRLERAAKRVDRLLPVLRPRR